MRTALTSLAYGLRTAIDLASIVVAVALLALPAALIATGIYAVLAALVALVAPT